MNFKLEKIVPWGRSFNEYLKMFSLSPDDLRGQILDCGGGPSSFNAELTAQGGTVVSCDPIYTADKNDIQTRINQTYDKVVSQSIFNKNMFIWKNIKSPYELGKLRVTAMRRFLNDFPEGKKQGRYVAESLPDLSFYDRQFDLALSSHFLFLYTSLLSLDFHKKAVLEMIRTAREIRVFPLLDLAGNKSEYIDDISLFMRSNGYAVKIEKVDYEFQRGANKMMRVFKK